MKKFNLIQAFMYFRNFILESHISNANGVQIQVICAMEVMEVRFLSPGCNTSADDILPEAGKNSL